VSRPLAVAVHVFLQVGGEVLEDEVQAGLAVLLDVLDVEEPVWFGGWVGLGGRRGAIFCGLSGGRVVVGREGKRRKNKAKRNALDDVVALAEHLEQRDLAQRGRGDALLLHLRVFEWGWGERRGVRVGAAREGKDGVGASTGLLARAQNNVVTHLQARLLQGHDLAIRLVLGLVHLAVRPWVLCVGGGEGRETPVSVDERSERTTREKSASRAARRRQVRGHRCRSPSPSACLSAPPKPLAAVGRLRHETRRLLPASRQALRVSRRAREGERRASFEQPLRSLSSSLSCFARASRTFSDFLNLLVFVHGARLTDRAGFRLGNALRATERERGASLLSLGLPL
jgi:hypothetical protein